MSRSISRGSRLHRRILVGRRLVWRSMRRMARSGLQIAATAKPFKPGSISIISAAVLFILITGIVYEIFTYRLEAFYFAALARKHSFRVANGESDSVFFPQAGPLNRVRGYTAIGSFAQSLKKNGYVVERQSRWSPSMLDLAAKGINPPYREKIQSGLDILGAGGETLFSVRYPRLGYSVFDSIPELIANTLLFIEDRNLLDTLNPFRNPAVDWPRFINVAGKLVQSFFVPVEGNLAGGSTLATQLEKFRYSQHGLTQGPVEKLRQMFSASLRAYRQGNQTIDSRREILLEYLNSVPLSAFPGIGEVHGLADGLETWYGASFDSVNHYLRAFSFDPLAGSDPQFLRRAAVYYRMVVNLLVAFRRGSYYLLTDPSALDVKSATFLRLLRDNHVAPPHLCDAALEAQVVLRTRQQASGIRQGFISEQKAADAVRFSLLGLLGVPGFYDLNRLDLTVQSTFSVPAQKGVTDFFAGLYKPRTLDSLGLRGWRMLSSGTPDAVIYSMTLFEHRNGRNLLRVQTDSYNNPLDFNDGTKMDLGSTAKLRTLVSYLQIVEDIHRRYAAMPAHELRAQQIARSDHLRLWVRDFVLARPQSTTADMVEAALGKEYSGSTDEAFFTGGGLHRFSNFDHGQGGYQSVRSAFHRSNNLVFIRMMRDIVHYYMFANPQIEHLLSETADHRQRSEFLHRFAEFEGRYFLRRFHRQLRRIPGTLLADSLAMETRATRTARSVIYLSVEPQPSIEGLRSFLTRHGFGSIRTDELRTLYNTLGPDSMNLADRGYLSGIHPLKLWVASYLSHEPDADVGKVTLAGMPQVMWVYDWLFKSGNVRQQSRRIRTILEMQAFNSIQEQWRAVGYPFDYLVPSFATAIGASADRPSSLAHLIGIIQNDGVHYHPVRIESFHFAHNTPYETIMGGKPRLGRRVLSSEVAAGVKQCLLGVVSTGTAIRARSAFTLSDGTVMSVGGKTGTGDHRRRIYDSRGRFVREEVRSRSAVFVFLIGDRFFGTLTVIVPGSDAASFAFTSSYAVQIFNYLAPILRPVVEAAQHIPDVSGPVDHFPAPSYVPAWLLPPVD